MPIRQFRNWTPDIAPLLGGPLTAYDTIPADDGYLPMPKPLQIGPQNYGTTPLKLFSARSSDNEFLPLCLGTSFSAYVSPTGWTTCANSIFASESWDAIVYGDFVYAVNGVNPYTKIDIRGNGDFSFVDVPNGLTGKYIAQVADFVMLMDVREAMAANRYPYRVQWSGLARPERFGLIPEIQADYQDVSDIGELRQILGGEYGMLLGGHGLCRVDYVGGNAIFAFQTLEVDVGCDISNSAVKVGEMFFWHSKRGWRMSTGGPSQPIGAGICDRWFLDRFKASRAHRMSHQVYPNDSVIMWSFVSKFSQDDEPDECLAYNWRLQRWTPGKLKVAILGTASQRTAFTDDPIISLPGWTPSAFTDSFSQLTDVTAQSEADFAAAMIDGTLCNMGSVSDTVIRLETEEVELTPGSLARLRRFRPIVNDCDRISATIRTRNNQNISNFSSRAGLRLESSGSFHCSERGRYHSISLDMTTPVGKMIGIDFNEITPSGGR